MKTNLNQKQKQITARVHKTNQNTQKLQFKLSKWRDYKSHVRLRK